MTSVISISGGRTSAYMTWRLAQERDLSDWFIMFANTGKERDQTLDFLHEIETRWSIPITWVEYDRVPARSIDLSLVRTRSVPYIRRAQESDEETHWYRVVSYETAHRNGQPNSPFDKLLEWMSVLPNPTARACTAELKIRAMARHLWSSGIREWTDHIGIRYDEADRAIDIRAMVPKYIDPAFPLIDWKITEPDVMEFWSRQDFDLRLKSYEGNCDLCFLKSQAKRVRLMRENPGMADWWIEWERKKKEKKNGGRFRDEQTYSALQYMANHPRLFEIDDPAFGGEQGGDGCACMTMGYKHLDEPPQEQSK